MDDEGEHVDGRSLRRQRNREAVIDAFIELTMAGEQQPSVDDIAEKAGVSYRSVYRYFEDRSDMQAAAADRAMDWIRPLLAKASGPYNIEDPLDHRIDSIVDARAEVYAQIADVIRSALLRSSSEPAIGSQFDEARRILRDQINARFHPELDMFTQRERELRLTSMDIALSFSSLDYIITERKHTREEMERLLRAQIRSAVSIPERDLP
ncbi:MAG: TetR/AcrR family transcriptional regulator [Actinomycetota bacterium]